MFHPLFACKSLTLTTCLAARIIHYRVNTQNTEKRFPLKCNKVSENPTFLTNEKPKKWQTNFKPCLIYLHHLNTFQLLSKIRLKSQGTRFEYLSTIEFLSYSLLYECNPLSSKVIRSPNHVRFVFALKYCAFSLFYPVIRNWRRSHPYWHIQSKHTSERKISTKNRFRSFHSFNISQFNSQVQWQDDQILFGLTPISLMQFIYYTYIYQ